MGHRMAPAVAGQALLASAGAVHKLVLALAEGRVAPPKFTRAGYRRFAPYFDRKAGLRTKPYTLAWLAQQIGSQYPSGQGTPWITAGLQLCILVERGAWGEVELRRALAGERGFTCSALCKMYARESHLRLKYVRRKKKAPATKRAVGFGRTK